MISCLLLSACLANKNEGTSPSTVDWIASFIVWNGQTYVINTSEKPTETVSEVEYEIGEIQKYSNENIAYHVNSSNYFSEGTKLYKIKGLSTEEAIAAKDEDGSYIKATRQDL